MSDIATPGPIDPADGQPDRRAEVSALKAWFRENLVSLALTAAGVALVCVYLDPLDTLKVVIGLGLVIFLHELGHFLAAKWCDVHVKTFSIGFGPAVPFCSYKWGETTYMVGVIPLGGYVSMTGEGTGESMPDADPDDDTDPRSFKNKPVGQRMLIISAGVVMNVILGMACFAAAYLHGVREEPGSVGTVASGSAAWRAGVRTGDDILKIGSRENPTFKDLRPIVMSTDKGEKVPVVVRHADGKTESLEVEPLREEGQYFPTLGVTTEAGLTLVDSKKRLAAKPAYPGTPAARAADPGFEPGDRVVGLSDPATYPAVTPLPLVADPAAPARQQADYAEFHRRMVLLAGKPVVVQVRRKGQPDDAPPVDVTVAPAYRADLGVRMRMGEVVAVRKGSAAAREGGVVARAEDAGAKGGGDKIVQVSVTHPDGKRTWWVADGKRPEGPNGAKPDDLVKPLDPVLLPHELGKWAAEYPASGRGGLKVELVVLRVADHAPKRLPLVLDYDDSFRFDEETVTLPNSPVPVPGLGLAYWVEAVVNEVEPGSAAAELRPGDLVTAVRFKSRDAAGAVKDGDWDEIKPHQWAYAEAAFQTRPPFDIDLKVKRGEEEREVSLAGKADPNWPTADRGLAFQPDYRTQRAADLGDALNLGGRRTVRFIKEVYMNLYAMVFGRVSPRTMSGPLTIATVSYRFAGEDFWQFLLFLGMISVNLAVVNFLPIPVLDGGHMVFLIIEKVLGRPVPERLFAAAMWAGLVAILLLFVFVITLDVRRVFFGWF